MNKINCLSPPSCVVSWPMANTKVQLQKKCLKFEKKCYWLYNFCRVADFVGWAKHTCISHSTYAVYMHNFILCTILIKIAI